MKKVELKNCPICGKKLKKAIVERDGVAMAGYKCEKCDEVYFSSGEIVRYEILTKKIKPSDYVLVTLQRTEEIG